MEGIRIQSAEQEDIQTSEHCCRKSRYEQHNIILSKHQTRTLFLPEIGRIKSYNIKHPRGNEVVKARPYYRIDQQNNKFYELFK